MEQRDLTVVTESGYARFAQATGWQFDNGVLSVLEKGERGATVIGVFAAGAWKCLYWTNSVSQREG
jgi:hypothetical protein